MSNICIVWRSWQGRVESMKKYFGFEVFYIGFSFRNRIFRPIEYFLKIMITGKILFKKRPQTVWIQLPPPFLIYIVLLYKLFLKEVIIIADCHNSLFRKPWSILPLRYKILNKYVDVILVHNHYVYKDAMSLEVNSNRCLILETRPANSADAVCDNPLKINKEFVLFPASYDDDEPIELLLNVARELPEYEFVFTGNTDRAKGLHDLSNAPSNVIFTGFINGDQFKQLYYDCSIVIGLTLFEGVQLSTANEAVGFGKAMVLSNTGLLKDLFYKGAIYVEHSQQQLVDGIKQCLNDRINLEQKVNELKNERRLKWNRQASVVMERINKSQY